MKKTLALILAGGRVDELNVLTLYRPKSAVPFGGLYRIIDFPLSNLMNSGIVQVGILSQYRSDSLMHHVGSGASWDMVGSRRGVYFLPPVKGAAHSDWYRGTADAVYQNLEFIQQMDPDYILILSGDHVYRMNYQNLIRFHEQKDAEITLAMVETHSGPLTRFGQGVMSEDGALLRYEEKPAQPISSWISMTVYLFSADTLYRMISEEFKPGETEHFGRDLFPNAVGRYKLYGYKHKDLWAYTRSPYEYWTANMALLDDPDTIDLESWQIRTNMVNEFINERAPSEFGASAEVSHALIQNGCRIDGRVEHSILFPGVHIEKGCEVRDSILMFDTIVRAGSRLDGVITDVECTIGERAQVGAPVGEVPAEDRLTVLGRNVVVPADYHIGGGCLVYPNKVEVDFPSSGLSNGKVMT
jgi:glucose-1-phosphate adenylyltransferase